jgi:predicted metalloprotease with PDZ domain
LNQEEDAMRGILGWLPVVLCVGFVRLSMATSAVTVEVDATAASRGIERTHLVMPVKSGPLTLLFPKWLPGEHSPDGPIAGLSGLTFTANGRPLAWHRDLDNMFAFHLRVPPGVKSLNVSFEVVSVPNASDGNALRTSTDSLAIVLWNQLVLYPAGTQSDDIQYTARLLPPAGWSAATALPRAEGADSGLQFRTVSLTTLIDSPAIIGRFVRTLELGGTPPVYLHLAADSSAAVEIPEATQEHLRKLVGEATALFGATHYGAYHFLWTLSDRIQFEGIEHHESSDNRIAERALIDEDMRHSASFASLLPHEYTHSWNGKYRRPAGLATGNYDAPMRGDLLWVYEGLTEYIGLVLGARSGLASAEDARDSWADVAALMEAHRGREWRSLADTAVAAQLGYTEPQDWRARERGTDFYPESALLWLEADTLIRTRTQGAKSLDDFCRLFYGPPSGAPKVIPYDFEAVVVALNTVLPYDWHTFWTERLERIKAGAPLSGLAASGWRLTYTTEPSAEQKGEAALWKSTDLRYSLGFLLLEQEGPVITYLIPGSPADQAGMTTSGKLIAVNGRRYSKELLQDVLKTGGSRPITLLVEDGDTFKTYDLHYSGQARYPHLERDPQTPDLLTAIETPLTQ